MNALELADELEAYGSNVIAGESPFIKHAKMLRQQQTEIEYWKEKFDKAMELKSK
jgi:hypothetical protein